MIVGIGTVPSNFKDDADDLDDIIQKINGTKANRVQLFPLAGPNDIVQWIGDVHYWQQIGFYVAGWLTAKIGDKAFDALWEKLSKAIKGNPPKIDSKTVNDMVSDVVRLAQAIHQKGGSLQLRVGLDEPEPNGYHQRGTYIDFPTLDVEKEKQAAETIARFALMVENLAQRHENTTNILVSGIDKKGNMLVTLPETDDPSVF